MAGKNRTARHDVNALISQQIHRFSFFQLAELLNRLAQTDPEYQRYLAPEQEPVLFKATASTGFHHSDLVDVSRRADGRYELEVAFLGLHGSQSPLPGYYLDDLAYEYAQQDGKVSLFLDFFHHRLLTLLHRIWRKFRYYIRFRDDGEDSFSWLMFALVGVGSEALQQALPVNRAKMLSYAGLLASPGRSPEVVSGIVRHCFDLASAEVLSWQMRNVPVAEDQQSRLGRVNSCLGQDMVTGDKVRDCAGKFLLQISELSFSRFLNFLPSGGEFQPLVRLMAFVMRDQLAWDLRLCFAAGEARGMRFGDDQSVCLGWCSFLGRPPADPCVIICVQE